MAIEEDDVKKVGKKAGKGAAKAAEISAARRLAPRQYQIKPTTGSGSTVLNIVDTKFNPTTKGHVTTGPPKWVKATNVKIDKLASQASKSGSKTVSVPAVRVDKPHVGTQHNHINIEPVLSRAIDPHVPISNTALTLCKGVDKTASVMQKANKVLLPLAIAIDTCRIGHSVYKDRHRIAKGKTPKKTIKTGASVAGGWGGGFLGGWGGASGGAWIGGVIGAAFGGVGAVPGAAIGGLVGSIAGAISGGVGASYGAQRIAEEILSDESDDED